MLTNYDEFHDFFERSAILSGTEYHNDYMKTIRFFPEANWKDAFSRGQLRSKQWIVDTLQHLNKPLGTVYLCAGWYGTLAYMLFQSNISIDRIRSFDIDESCWRIAERLNKKYVDQGWRFKASTGDIHDITYSNLYAGNRHFTTMRNNGTPVATWDPGDPDTIINTSCEHIRNFHSWYNAIPQGKLLVLQSNNFFKIEDHVNCYNNVQEFITDCPMSELQFADELDCGEYKRFMIIGRK
tara:strand:- start:824 stop:1540 length:717 start_codon:yes stop_codon:yes gene_type:complete